MAAKCQFSVRVDPKLVEGLGVLAALDHSHRTSIINKAIEAYVKKNRTRIEEYLTDEQSEAA